MDFDAIVVFKRVLSKTDINENDKLLMSSAINNENIDINLSIRDNLKIAQEDDISLEEFKTYLMEFMDNNDDYLNTPIYLLLLQKKELRKLLLLAHKIQVLDDKSLLDIIESILLYMNIADEKDYPELANFLNDLLSVRRTTNSSLFQSSSIIKAFIISNHDSLSSDLSKVVGLTSIQNFYDRLIILKLFSYGFANFSFAEVYDPSIDGLSAIIEPLLKKRSYGHLRLVINTKTINSDDALRVKELIINHLNENKIDSLEDSIKVEKLINDLNNILRFINADALIKLENHLSF